MLPKGKEGLQWHYCIFLVLLQSLSVQSSTDPEDSTVLLSSLPPGKLDDILDNRLEELQLDIFRVYQEQLKSHERTIDQLERRKRQIGNDPVAVLPPYDDNFGHSYTFNTGVGNREEVRIDRLDLVAYLGSLTVTNVFPLHLTNLTAIYKGQDGLGYVVVDGNLKVLSVRNEWTASTSGCRCDGSSTPISRSHETCACCMPGACLCSYSLGYNGDACVPCGTEAVSCPKAGTKALELDTAIGFEFVIPSTGLRRIVVTAKSTVISFYSVDEFGLQIVRSDTGLSTIVSEHLVTHLGYGEIYVNHHGILKKKRFLISFCAGQRVQQLHELMVGSSDTAIAVGLSTVWHTTGTAMKVTQNGGKLIITVLEGNHLKVYELKEDLWREFNFQLIQHLRLHGTITTWNLFSTGFQHYLALISDNFVRIYIQNEHYHLLTTLNVDGEINRFDNVFAVNLRSCRNELVLVAGSGSRAAVYVWDWSVIPPVLQRVNIYNLEVNNGNWKLAFGYPVGDDVRIILPGPTVPVVYLLQAHLDPVNDVLFEEHIIVSETIEKFKDEYGRQAAIIASAEDRLRNSIDFNNDVNANITILQSVTISRTLITNVLVANQVSLPGTDISGTDYLRRLNATRSRLDSLINQLGDIQTSLDGAISSLESGRPVEGVVTIINPGLNLRNLIANNLNIVNLLDMNGTPVDIEGLLNGIVRLGDGRKVSGRKLFSGFLVVEELATQFLDDILITDLVKVGREQTIAGAIFRSAFSAQEIIVQPGATIAGIDITKAIQLNEFFTLGRTIFDNIVVEGNIQLNSNIVNGVDLHRLFQNALLRTGGEVIGSLAFIGRELVITSLDARELMGIDVVDFQNNVVFKDKPALLEGRLTIGGRVALQNLRVDGKINGRNFLDYPLRSDNGPIAFRGQKHFSNIIFSNVKFGLQGTVDGIDPRTLVTKSTSQVISASKVFGQGVHIRENLEISSKIIDGVNLDHIGGSTAILPGSGVYDFDVVFTSPVTVSRLSLTGLLNGLDFSAFASDILYDDGSSRVSGFKRFLSGLTVRSAQINGLLNGDGIDSLITTTKDHVISDIKTLIKSTSFNTLHASLVDGLDLNEFVNSVVLLDRDGQIISGKKIFTNTVFIRNLDLTGRLSNIDFSNVVTKSGNQIFTASQTLNAAIFNEVQVQSIRLGDGFTVNGIDISDLAARRVSLKSPVDHTGTLIIDGPFTVVGNLIADNINGVNIVDLEKNLVMDKGDCTITGPITISNLEVGGSVSTRNGEGASGLNLRNIADRAVKLDRNNRLQGNLTFGNLELHGDVNVQRLVNGVHLLSLKDDAVYKNLVTLQNITGLKSFLQGIHVKGNINTETTIGVDLSTRLFTRHTDQHISSHYTFKNILAENGVTLLGNFNDIDLRTLRSAAKTTQSRYDGINFRGSVRVGELVIDGHINGINLLSRLQDAVRLAGAGNFGISLTGHKSFLSTTQFSSLDVSRLNGVNLDDFLANIILRNANKVISRPMTVNGFVSAPWLTAEHIVVDGTVDGVDYRALKNNAVYLSRLQNIQTTLIFDTTIVVKGNVFASFLNGRSILGDYLTKNTEQTITVDGHLASVSSTHIEVTGTVNGIFLPDLKDLTMQVIGGQVISGITTIKGNTRVLGNIEVTGRTGKDIKLKLRSEVIGLLSGGDISGLLRFPVPLVTSSLTSSVFLINGIDILSLYNNALYVDLPATVTARLLFTSSVTIQNGLIVSGGVNGLHIDNLYNTTAVILAQFGNTTTEIKAQYASMCNSIISLYDQLEDSLYEGDCFQYVYMEFFPELRHSSISLHVFGLTYLILSYEHRCYSEVYVWSNITNTFNFYQSLSTTGKAHEWVHVETIDGRHFIAAAASSTVNDCIDQNSTIWEITRNSIQLAKVLASGESVSVDYLGGKTLIHVYSLTSTITYEYRINGLFWVEVSQTSKYEMATSVVEDGFTISFRSNGGIGEIWVEGNLKQEVRLGHLIHDSILVTFHERIILFVVVTVDNPQGATHELRAYEIDYGNLVWLHSASLRTPGKIGVFFVGNDACAAAYIAITQKGLFPIIYNFFSERLTIWREIVVPRTTWIQYFRVPNRRFQQIFDHYLIFGRNDNTALVYSLLMRGSTVPKIDYSCEIEAFRNPLLKPIVLI